MEAKSSGVSRISTNHFVKIVKESMDNGQRFCFILGSGASVSSGIPMGRVFEMQWMDSLMEIPDDSRNMAEDLYSKKIIKTPFSEIEKAWKDAKTNGGHIPSDYYFDIYELRFPEKRNGYKFLEKYMENAQPSVGYCVLAQVLAADNGLDIVITTNFDSLIEDALFIYTNDRPIVAAHESLADYIDFSKKQRAVIAKVHRGLFFKPMNDRRSTRKLSKEWAKVLNKIFTMYTPIVIGYAGGDGSLMSYLEDGTTEIQGCMYWCLMKGEEPSDRIKKLMSNKSGRFVEISGFDDVMLALGKALEGQRLCSKPNDVGELLEKNAKVRRDKYQEQWNEIEKRTNQKQEPNIAALIEEVKDEENEREKAGKLTAEDHFRRGNRFNDAGKYNAALREYTKAVELNPDYSNAYNNRGHVYNILGNHKRAIIDLTKAIELNPNNASAYNNRGYAYGALGNIEKAMEDFGIAIEQNPNSVNAYNNRGFMKSNMGNNEQAIKDFNKAIELNPGCASAYNNRGYVYANLGDEEQAMEDFKKAIELDSGYANPYKHRGSLHFELGNKEQAMKDLNKAVEINPNYIEAYRKRAQLYRSLSREEEARVDEARADEIENGKKKKR